MRDQPDLLLTDFYQLTMLQAYHDYGMDDTAVFEFFVRKLPTQRHFLLAAGLEQVLGFLEQARFSGAELAWLRGSGRFRHDFIDALADWRFTGEVDAMPEGSVFFSDEPILRIVAPLQQAQLIETRIINLLQLQTMIASKAARCVLAANGRMLVDFGLRRAHGAEAGLYSARASYLAGFAGTSTVLAGIQWGIPLFGTMAHSYIQAHDDETVAFEHFARSSPMGAILLIDTYDTEAGARQLVRLAPQLAQEGITLYGVRIDSGDLIAHARRVRRILDEARLPQIRILASGNLDEYGIRAALEADAPIDGFGVGTRMNTSADQPYLDCAYKLQEYAGRPRRKRSEGKATWPGRKQVYRCYGPDGRMAGDTLTTWDDVRPDQGLLRPVMLNGRRIVDAPTLPAIRDYAQQQIALLPLSLQSLDAAAGYPVTISQALREMTTRVEERER
jgi:nicotinate phosphoribosyltransferase